MGINASKQAQAADTNAHAEPAAQQEEESGKSSSNERDTDHYHERPGTEEAAAERVVEERAVGERIDEQKEEEEEEEEEEGNELAHSETKEMQGHGQTNTPLQGAPEPRSDGQQSEQVQPKASGEEVGSSGPGGPSSSASSRKDLQSQLSEKQQQQQEEEESGRRGAEQCVKADATAHESSPPLAAHPEGQGQGQQQQQQQQQQQEYEYQPYQPYQPYYAQAYQLGYSELDRETKPLDLTPLSEEEKQKAIATMREQFDASLPLHVTGIVEEQVSCADLERVFAQFGRVNSISIDSVKKDTAIVRMPSQAAQRAKGHFASEPLVIKDRPLQVNEPASDSLLFVGNVSEEADAENLRPLFQPHGQIERLVVMRSTATGHKKGYALVDMRTKAQAGEARAALGSCIFFGRSLRVDWCRLGKLEEFQSCVLFVDKLPFGYIEYSDLLQLFQQHGQVKNLNMPMNPVTQVPRGFAFVTYESAEEAETARNALHNAEFQGASLRISFANPSKPDSPAGSPGGGRGYSPTFGRGWGRGFSPFGWGRGFNPAFAGFMGRGYVVGRGPVMSSSDYYGYGAQTASYEQADGSYSGYYSTPASAYWGAAATASTSAAATTASADVTSSQTTQQQTDAYAYGAGDYSAYSYGLYGGGYAGTGSGTPSTTYSVESTSVGTTGYSYTPQIKTSQKRPNEYSQEQVLYDYQSAMSLGGIYQPWPKRPHQ